MMAPAGGSEAVPAIRAAGLVKDFSFRRILDGVSLEVPPGACLAVFGPNGAGKTTLLRILATLSRPTQGQVEIEGRPVHGARIAAARARLGLVSHQSLLYDGLTGLENMAFFGGLYLRGEPDARIEALLRRFDLWDRRDDRAGTYSRGMQQRLSLARALVHDPAILILDEPETGLDPDGVRLFGDVLREHRSRGGTAVMTTHDVARGLAHADSWIVLVDGRIAAEGPSRPDDAAGILALYGAAARAAAAPRDSVRGFPSLEDRS